MEKRSEGRLTEVAETLAYHSSLTNRADLAFIYNALAGAKSLGVFSLGEANGYFASALALYQHDPECADNEQFAAFLANYALCSNISLRVKTMIELAVKVRPILSQFGDSRHQVHFLHHFCHALSGTASMWTRSTSGWNCLRWQDVWVILNLWRTPW